jgi:hypothetical protein
MTGLKRVARVLTLVFVAGWVSACDSGAMQRVEQPPTGTPVAAMHPLDQAALAFEGNHTRAQIEPLMDKAMALYKVPQTPEFYSRAASSLVALRKANGTAEMAILDHMVRSAVPGVTLTFPEAAAMSSVFLQAGDE